MLFTPSSGSNRRFRLRVVPVSGGYIYQHPNALTMAKKQPAIINAHTHVFIGKSIPPFISRTFIPWPFYYLVNIPLVLAICKWYYNSRFSPYKWKHQSWNKAIVLAFYRYRMLIRRKAFFKVLILDIINPLIAYHGIIYLIHWLLSFWIKAPRDTHDSGLALIQWLTERHLFYYSPAVSIRTAVIIFTFLFIATGRKIIILIFKQFWSFLKFLPDRTTIQFMARFINIGRFAYYNTSANIFEKLYDQYPPGSGFVILPMDMAFMDAGKINEEGTFRKQMNALNDIRAARPEQIFPFVFADPRRTKVEDQPFFEWTGDGTGGVTLDACFIKDFIEVNKFSGIKIYPALGYYPFDERLLPLWKYAADRQLPITTHCIRGTIFYRGNKKKEWDFHPVFKACEGGEHKDLLLPELKNVDFINNFTHPLNYLCLVEEPLLRIVVGQARDEKVRDLFGYSDAATPLKYNLRELKLCFGHYGGDDEWQRFFERDRDGRTLQLSSNPDEGVNFKPDDKVKKAAKAVNTAEAQRFSYDLNGVAYGRLEQIWRQLDWYTIISSMMLQYPNLYADVSYIIHDDAIYPLLKTTLRNDILKKRVLFGTDFYVVRNHKSEKEMLADARAALSDEEFQLIAGANPVAFLTQRPVPVPLTK